MPRCFCLVPARRLRMLTLTLALVFALAWVRGSDAESVKSRVKMQHSNPVLPALIAGERVNLIVTTDIDGILSCSDLPKEPSAAAKIDFDYARRLLRFQLQGVIQEFAVLDLKVPALQYAGKMATGYFHLKKQWLSPASIEYFLHMYVLRVRTGGDLLFKSSNASGFIGVGLAFRSMDSRFWTMFDGDSASSVSATQQYSYRGMLSSNATSKLAALAIRSPANHSASDAGEDSDSEDEEEDLVNGYIESTTKGATKLVSSETLAPVNDRDDPANSQGISFPNQDESSSPSSSSPSPPSSYPFNPQRAHDVEIFGEFSGNWDVALDFNVPCLALPQQFFDSLAGWIGLRYNDELKLAEISSPSMPLPDLVFSLSLDGPQLTIPLQRLVLPELQVATSAASSNANTSSTDVTTTQRICIQRSGSIMQNGAAVSSPLDQDAGSVQRCRLHGSLSLPLFNMFQAPIVFGAMVLDNFEQIVIDGTTKQTGIQDSVGGSSGSSASSASAYATCMRSAQCIGQQQYLYRLNACQVFGRDDQAMRHRRELDVDVDDRDHRGRLRRSRGALLDFYETPRLQDPHVLVVVFILIPHKLNSL